MASDKFTRKLETLSKKGFRGYPLAEIQYYGPSPYRAKKVVLVIEDEEGSRKTLKEFNTQGWDLRGTSNIDRSLLQMLKEHGVATLKMDERSRGCHKSMDDPECRYWKALPRTKDYDFALLAENGLKFSITPNESGELEFWVFKPKGLPGNCIEDDEGGVSLEGDDRRYITDCPVVSGKFDGSKWEYGVESEVVPGPGPDRWFKQTSDVEEMEAEIVHYYFSRDSLMRKRSSHIFIEG